MKSEKCQKCRTEYPIGSKYCPNCGRRYTPSTGWILFPVVVMFGIVLTLEYWENVSGQSMIVPGLIIALILVTVGLVLRVIIVKRMRARKSP